jgi:hypothetical protein
VVTDGTSKARVTVTTFRKICAAELLLAGQLGMNAKQPEKLLPPADRNELVAGSFGIASPHVIPVAFLILILSGFCAPRCGATVYDSDGSEANVRELLGAARDGDTITLPAGTFTWTQPVNITKAITLEGQTTISGAGTANPVVKDLTIIRDDTPGSGANGYILKADMSSNPSGVFRLTGVTFTGGTLTKMAAGNGAIRLRSVASTPASMRLDHCHFTSTLQQGKFIWVNGWVYGVADHNMIEATRSIQPFHIYHSTYGGTSQLYGNGAWADYPWYGTEKFFFIEDNTAIRTNSLGARGLVDSLEGGRIVVRHNYLQNMVIGSHGTEAGPARGHRVSEIYDNTFNYTVSGWRSGFRSGTNLFHDNVASGTPPSDEVICGLPNFRETAARPNPIWGIADGTSPWDVNDTEGNGTYVEGHPPFLFASGSATSETTVSREQSTFSDSTKTWTPNQWIGYSIKITNPASASYGSHGRGSYIIGNDAHSISYAYTRDTGGRGQLLFNAGDTYEIHRVLVVMDQNGRGKGDQLAGNPPINTTTGTASWNHGALEPCYSWNNIYTPNGHAMGYGVRRGQPTTKLNIDFFNLGAGFPADSTPSQVSSRYTAALNGVDYVGTFVYPHPLVSGIQRSSSATRGPSNTSRKKAKKLKRTKAGHKKIGD